MSYTEGMGDARAFFAVPHVVRVHRKVWAQARWYADQRVKANADRRGGEHDSHPGFSHQKNMLQEVTGLVAEILVLEGVQHSGLPVEGLLLHPEGTAAVKAAPDVVVTDGDDVIRIEVKCHMFLTPGEQKYLSVPAKKFFAVNVRAVASAKAAGSEIMLPVLVAPGGQYAILGRAIPLEQIESWGRPDYGHGNEGYGLPIGAACETLFSHSLADAERVTRVGWTTRNASWLCPAEPLSG